MELAGDLFCGNFVCIPQAKWEQNPMVMGRSKMEAEENFEIRKKTRDELNDKVTQMKIEKSLKESNLNSIKEKINNIFYLCFNTSARNIFKFKDIVVIHYLEILNNSSR